MAICVLVSKFRLQCTCTFLFENRFHSICFQNIQIRFKNIISFVPRYMINWILQMRRFFLGSVVSTSSTAIHLRGFVNIKFSILVLQISSVLVLTFGINPWITFNLLKLQRNYRSVWVSLFYRFRWNRKTQHLKGCDTTTMIEKFR